MVFSIFLASLGGLGKELVLSLQCVFVLKKKVLLTSHLLLYALGVKNRMGKQGKGKGKGKKKANMGFFLLHLS